MDWFVYAFCKLYANNREPIDDANTLKTQILYETVNSSGQIRTRHFGDAPKCRRLSELVAVIVACDTIVRGNVSDCLEIRVMPKKIKCA